MIFNSIDDYRAWLEQLEKKVMARNCNCLVCKMSLKFYRYALDHVWLGPNTLGVIGLILICLFRGIKALEMVELLVEPKGFFIDNQWLF